MGNALVVHFESSTKRQGTTEKRQGTTEKRQGTTEKGLAEEMPQTYGDFGAYGDYVITTKDGEFPVFNAVTIRVLDHGELNLITDSGRWFLFAPGEWKRVSLFQPQPGQESVRITIPVIDHRS
jgi:hypothetical protein